MASILVAGDTSGSVTISAPAVSGSSVLTLPAVTDTLVGLAATQTLTNKTLSSGTVLPAGSIIQIVNLTTGAVATGTTTIPFDDTIPQNTEGDQYLSLAITPTSATNKLFIQVVIFCTTSSGVLISTALFQDSTASALGATTSYMATATGGLSIPMNHYMISGTTSATTFKVRVGGAAACTITLNGQSGARSFGGVMSSSITITEIKV